jgi:hypothetical protein
MTSAENQEAEDADLAKQYNALTANESDALKVKGLPT